MPTSANSEKTTVQLRCIGCGQVQAQAAADFRCPACKELLEVVYPERQANSELTPAKLKQTWQSRRASLSPLDQSGVWRFRDLLPILRDTRNAVTLREGNTPLYELPGCAKSAGMDKDRLSAKHLGMNPTGSFKDAGMTAALSVAKEKGFTWVGCASTGNTSASMAAYAARAGLRSLVLIPEGKIAWGKLSQSIEYGALTCQLRTDFDGCLRILTEAVHKAPVYLLNSVNPYRIEGQKTVAFELMEQLDWNVPAHIIIPGGNLANSSALGKGFLELKELGFITSLPKISIIQAIGANPLVRSMRENAGKQLIPVTAETMATAIRIGNPASWRKAVSVLNATGGSCEEVSEEEIAIAKAEIGADGIGCEPASAVTLAGLKKLRRSGFVQAHEKVVLILTGHLLKDPDYTLAFHRGELFSTPGYAATYAAELNALRRPPIQLDSSADAVLRLIESSPQ